MNHLQRIVLIFICITSCTTLRAQWERIGTGGGGQIDIKLQHDNYLYGTDATSTIYRSSDYGKTWRALMNGIDENYFSYRGTISAINDEFVSFVSDEHKNDTTKYKQGAYIMRYADTAWRFYPDTALFGRYPLRQYISYDSIFAVNVNEFRHEASAFLSTDAGKTWAVNQTFSFGNNYTFFKLLKFKNSFCIITYWILDNIFYTKSYITKDRGKSWVQTQTAPYDSSYYNFSLWQSKTKGDSGICVGIAHAHEGVIISTTTNAGESWNRNILAPKNYYLSGIAQINIIGDEVFFVVGTLRDSIHTDYTTYRSRDWGSTREKLSLKDSSVPTYVIAKTYSGYVVQKKPTVFLTDSLFRDSLPVAFLGMPHDKLDLVYSNNNTIFAVMDNGSCLNSDDDGKNWKPIQLDRGIKMSNREWIDDGKQLYTTGINDNLRHVILVSEDQGFHWRVLRTFGIDPNFFIAYVAYYVIFAIETGNSSFNGRYRSTDGGRTWSTSFNSGYKLSPGTFAFVNGRIYTGNEWYSDTADYQVSSDLGETWEKHYFPDKYKRIPFVRMYSIGDQLFFTSRTSTYTRYPYSKVYSRLYSFDTDRDTIIVADSGIGKDEGIDNSPIHYDRGVYYITSTPTTPYSNQNGKCKLYYSLDSLKSWKEAPGTVLNATTNFTTKDHVYLSGGGTVWRQAKKNFVEEPHTIRTYPKTLGVTLYPNPASSELSLTYSIPAAGDVSVSIVDVTGRTLIQVLDHASFLPGVYTIPATITSLPSGMYFVRVRSNGVTVVKKFLKF